MKKTHSRLWLRQLRMALVSNKIVYMLRIIAELFLLYLERGIGNA